MWTCSLFQISTGLLGPALEFDDFSWSIELNGTETWSISLKKSTLPRINYDYWLAPWWAGVAFFYDGVPIVAGPILNIPNDSFTDLDLSGVGIRGIFARRKVTEELGEDWTTLPGTNVGWSGYSLNTIAKFVVQKSQMKNAGALPISYPIPDEFGTHERNYKGFNISNISTDQVLTKLSNVRHGPDILFKPRLADIGRLTFDFWTGTNINPRIHQNTFPVWDTTPVKGSISSMRLTTTGTYQSFRVYSTGAGIDAGIKMDVVTNIAPLQKEFPLLETSISSSNSEDIAIVRAHGISNLEINSNVLQEVEIHVRADGVNKLGTFWPGDLVQVYVKDFVTLKDGLHEMRLLAITGNTTNDIMLNLQSENKFISTQSIEELAEDVP